MQYKIKVTTGFRRDQYHTIEADEAHKAYYLFLNPGKRGVFSNGVALVGKNIQEIEPDYNATMEWNPSHQLQDDDWNEIRQLGVDKKLKDILSDAKRVAYMINDGNIKLLDMPLQKAIGDVKELPSG